MKTKLLLPLLALTLLSGCTAFQPSTYTNYNTPYGNVVRATGTAASNSAFANTSYNCPSCAISGNSRGNSRGGSGGYRNYNNQTNEMGKITNTAVRTLSNSISSEINEAITDSFSKF